MESPTPLLNSKAISPSQLYNAFARVGIDYGPAFRALSDIRVDRASHIAESKVKLHPVQPMATSECRYIVHPAALDVTFQLAILAAHKGKASQIGTGFRLESLERLVIRPLSEHETSTLAVAEVRSASVDRPAAHLNLEVNGKHFLHASGVRFAAPKSVPRVSSDERVNPFTRVNWQPDFSLLTGLKAATLYPSNTPTRGNGVLPMLDQLALHQIIQFYAKYSEFFNKGSAVPHLQRFLDWMNQKVEAARQDQIPGGAKIIQYSNSERDEKIEELQASLMENYGAETQLMCHMYKNLPDIYNGVKTGLQAAVENRYLDRMYEYMKLYQDGTKILKDMVALISHQNPKLKIFEVGGGTGSATREILPALRGHTLYRGYDSYTFTDLGTAFLATAQDTYKSFNGVFYAPFDIHKDPASQGFNSDYDLVIASNVTSLLLMRMLSLLMHNRSSTPPTISRRRCLIFGA